MYEIAEIIKTKESWKKLSDIIASKGKETVEGKVLLEEFGEVVGTEQARPLIYILKSSGALSVYKPGYTISEYSFRTNVDSLLSLESQVIQWIDVIAEAQKLHENSGSEIQILATLPPVLSHDSHMWDVISVPIGITRLIVSSHNCIWMVNPFFDEVATAYLLPHLSNATSRKVRIRIITRDPNAGGSSIGHANAIEMLRSEVEEPSFLELRSFQKESTKGDGYALHSKVVMADEASCYIGSANITRSSFNRSFELGTILTGQSVMRIAQIVKAVWNASHVI